MPDTKLTPKQELQSECPDNCAHCESVRAGAVEGMSAPTDEWAEALSVEIQQCITRDGEEDPNGSIAELLLKRVAPLAEVRELREERDALKAHNEELMEQNATECERAERAESALREARNKALEKQINDDWTCWCEVCCIVRRGAKDKS